MNHALIVAGGSSTRMEGENKLIADIGGRPLLARTLGAFERCGDVDTITIVAKKGLFDDIKALAEKYAISKIKKIVEGGKERQDSVLNGLKSLGNCDSKDVVIIHNGSNPFARTEEISACIKEAKRHGAAACAFPLKDTIKKVRDDFVEKTLDRKDVWQMQTPQCIQFGLFSEAADNAKRKNIMATDDSALVEAVGGKVKIIPCSMENFKVTTPEDLALARKMISDKLQIPGVRVGLGQDSHRFSERKKPLVLGGYVVPNERGLEANSDGDVVLHSLFNALSSALGGRSLGITADEMCRKGVTDSRKYLKAIIERMNAEKLAIGNISLCIEAKKPKLEQHHDSIKKSLCTILAIGEGQIGLTFTSGEGLTGFGRGEGMQCLCMATLIG